MSSVNVGYDFSKCWSNVFQIIKRLFPAYADKIVQQTAVYENNINSAC